MAHIRKLDEMVNNNHITIELDVEDYNLADALYDIATRVENDDLLDGIYDNNKMEVVVNGDHYNGVIRKA